MVLSNADFSLKKVLVTGGLGYIGSHVVVSLLLTGRYLPVVVDNCCNARPEALERCAEVARDEMGTDAPQPLFRQIDLRDAAALEKVFKEFDSQGGIWAVIHLAALKAVGESGEIPLAYYRVNVCASVSLMECMEKHNCKKLVFSSSATVYGSTPSTIPIPESSPLQPESSYGRTKAVVEQIIEDVCKASAAKYSKSKAFKGVSLRYFNPAGAHPSGKLGEEPMGKPGNLLPILAQIAVARQSPAFKMFGNDHSTPDGTCVRDFLHIMDLAHGHVLALDAIAQGDIFDKCTPATGYYRAYNLGRGKGVSVFNIVETMRKVTGFNYQYEVVARRVGDVPHSTADPSRAKEELGFLATKSVDEMCLDLWNFQTKHVNSNLSA